MSSTGNTAAPMTAAQPPRVQFVEDFFVYEVDFAALAVGANQNGNIQIQADADFKLIKLAQFSDIAGAVETESSAVLPLATLQIVDSGSGRQLFFLPAPIPSLFGTGRLPFIMPIPRIFKARSNIAFAVTNFSNATTYNIRLSLIGTKIFQQGQ